MSVAADQQGKVHEMRVPHYLPVPGMFFVSLCLVALRPE
jgi:hypothetical protein